MKFKPRFMATVLGLVPHRNVEEACQLMIQNFPEAPYVPRVTRSLRMFFERTPCLKIDREKRELSFELSGRENELVEFYDRYLSKDLDYFAISPELNPSLYKLAEMFRERPWPELKLIHFMVPGLYSLGISVKDESGAPALYNDTLRDVMVKQLAMTARWRQREIKELFPGVPTLLHLTEPGLGVYSSAGGTMSWDVIKNAINEVIEGIDGITGIHCCDNFDWSLLMKTNIDLINFDAYHYGNTMSLYTEQLKRFLERGGMISWGIVPTTGASAGVADIENENPCSLVGRLEQMIQSVVDMGVDKEMLLESSWITPSCGCATLSIELANRVYGFTREVSQRMRKKYFGKVASNRL